MTRCGSYIELGKQYQCKETMTDMEVSSESTVKNEIYWTHTGLTNHGSEILNKGM